MTSGSGVTPGNAAKMGGMSPLPTARRRRRPPAQRLLALLFLLASAPGALAAAPELRLAVDLGAAAEGVITVQETLAVEPGALALRYPRWIPGIPAARGSVSAVAGLQLRAGGELLPWRRDARDPWTLHVDVPAPATELELAFQFLPVAAAEDHDEAAIDADYALIAFNDLLFYPAGRDVGGLMTEAVVTLPPGWRYASALPSRGGAGLSVQFAPVSLRELVDSPLLAGRHLRTFALSGRGVRPAAQLTVAGAHVPPVGPDADTQRSLAQLAEELRELFGHAPHERYELLVLLADGSRYFSLGHAASAELRLPADAFADARVRRLLAPLIAHEWLHAWNGRARMPAGTRSADFNTRPATGLLWVREGLSDYWAAVLAVRSGLWSAAYFRAWVAALADQDRHRRGRAWRSLQDTADAASLPRGGSAWRNWRRGRDHHGEGALLWLEVDMRLRELSRERRSLDDFARRLFASGTPPTYDFTAVVAALEAVQPGGWADFLRARLDHVGAAPPRAALARSGWQLASGAEAGPRASDLRDLGHGLDLTPTLGFSVRGDGRVRDVLWQGAAARAGLVPGLELVAVGGFEFSLARLEDAAAAGPVELLVRGGGRYRELRIEHAGGLRYPHLERVQGLPDRLAASVAPRRGRRSR